MDIFNEVYRKLANWPIDEQIELLQKLLPPQELFARMDGTRFIIRKHGLRIFETSTMLKEAGIPEDDPRNQVFKELRGGLIEKSIPDKLRNIAAKTDTACKQSGAISVWEGSRKAWWVPLAGTSNFKDEIERLIQDFEKTRDEMLIEDYWGVRKEAQKRWSDSSIAAWENLNKLGKTNTGKDEFMQSSIATFDELFPSIADIKEKVHIDLEPVQRALPEKIENILEEVRKAEKEKLMAETALADEQLKLTEIDRQIKEAERRQLEKERRTRDEILLQTIDPQIAQTRELILQVQSSLMRIAQEILTVAEKGGEVSPATMRSWNKRIDALSVFGKGNLRFEDAVERLRSIKDDVKNEGKPSKGVIDAAEKRISLAFQNLEAKADIDINADQIWQLMRGGQAKDALRRLAKIRVDVDNKLGEVDALFQLVSGVAANNELLEEEEIKKVQFESIEEMQEVVGQLPYA